MVESFALDTHFESGLGVGISAQFSDQPVTLIRLGGVDLDECWIAEFGGRQLFAVVLFHPSFEHIGKRVGKEKALRRGGAFFGRHHDTQTQARRAAAIAHAFSHFNVFHPPDRRIWRGDHLADEFGGAVVFACFARRNQRERFCARQADEL